MQEAGSEWESLRKPPPLAHPPEALCSSTDLPLHSSTPEGLQTIGLLKNDEAWDRLASLQKCVFHHPLSAKFPKDPVQRTQPTVT